MDLRCPRCNRKLAEIIHDYLDVIHDESAGSNKGKLFIKCPKCRDIAEF